MFSKTARTVEKLAKTMKRKKGVGWTLDGVNFVGGLLRMLFPFSMGMLLSRCFKPVKIRGAFWICSIVLLILFHIPFVEGSEPILMNGVFEMFCIIFVFPALVWLGASGGSQNPVGRRGRTSALDVTEDGDAHLVLRILLLHPFGEPHGSPRHFAFGHEYDAAAFALAETVLNEFGQLVYLGGDFRYDGSRSRF